MIVEIDGRQVRSEAEFHSAISEALAFPSFYGENLDALWDILSTDVERPVKLIWNHSASSKTDMAERFDEIVGILRKVERQDAEWNLPAAERFELVLR